MKFQIEARDVTDKFYIAVSTGFGTFEGVEVNLSAIQNGSPLIALEKGNEGRQFLLDIVPIIEALVNAFLSEIEENNI